MKLRDWIAQSGYKAKYIAQQLDLHYSNVWRICEGKMTISRETAQKIYEISDGQVDLRSEATRNKRKKRG